jgi:glycine/D-amino acid oxidase-like deaminating enzyme
MFTSEGPRSIVVVGGGIIGCTTAYYLTHHSSFTPSTSVTIIEASAHGVAQGASGKAGGLVARWAYPKELVEVSFDEHVRLAELHDGQDRWGWRFVNCGSWEGTGVDFGLGEKSRDVSVQKVARLGKGRGKTKGLPEDLTWVDEDLTAAYSRMAPDGATAQVHPHLFTTSMLSLADGKGAKLTQGKVTAITQSAGKVTGVKYAGHSGDENTLPATDVILCAGAWSPALLPDLPISATRAHSIVIRPQPDTKIAPYVLFTEIRFASSQSAHPEVYARPNDEIYACGSGDESPLPPSVDDVQVCSQSCDEIHAHISGISSVLRQGTVEKKQACFLPVGGPIVGGVGRGPKGMYVATGHTCWVSARVLL